MKRKLERRRKKEEERGMKDKTRKTKERKDRGEEGKKDWFENARKLKESNKKTNNIHSFIRLFIDCSAKYFYKQNESHPLFLAILHLEMSLLALFCCFRENWTMFTPTSEILNCQLRAICKSATKWKHEYLSLVLLGIINFVFNPSFFFTSKGTINIARYKHQKYLVTKRNS